MAATHRWLLVPVHGDPVPMDVEQGQPLSPILGGGVDFGYLSPHFHFAVYEHAMSELERSTVINRSGTIFAIYGPCLVYKVDDAGSTVSLTDADVQRVSDIFDLGRFGIGVDSMSLG